MLLQGTFTALVTPFNRDGSVDFTRLRALVEEQIAGGVEGLVPVGTTGESPTLSFDEHYKVVEVVTEAVARRVPVIAGTGGNSTDEAVQLTKHAQSVGVDATLQVTPYYNKPSQEGLYRHFATIADLGLPVVLYNVPGRTSREIAVETVARLAKHPKVAAIKEAAGDAARVSAIHAVCGLPVLCGDDALTVPMISIGACGVISVASNVMPRDVSDMVRAALAGDFAAARAAHTRLYPLFRDLFIDTNPVPVKAALARMGRIEEVYRLPLCELADKQRAVLDATLKGLGLI
jgi:4-hydroxy-tetrahydrodipicolinate synthase